MNIRTLLAATAVLSAGAGSAFAQASDTKQVDARAKFITALAVTSGTDLNFGTWVPAAAGGTIAINTAGTGRTGDGTPVTDANNTPSAGSFSIAAEAGQSMSLTLSQQSALTDYTLSNFVVAGDAGCSVASETAVKVATAGTPCVIKVGASLTYPAGASGAKDLGQLQAVLSYN